MRFLLLLPALLLAACTAESPAVGSEPPVSAPGQPPMGEAPPADTSAARPGVALAAILDQTADDAALMARLGPPRRLDTEAVENRHVPGQMDTLRIYRYDGLALEFYDITGAGVLLQRVEATGAGYDTAEGIGVGSTRAAVDAAYGAPVDTHEDGPIYEIPSGPDDPTPLRLQVDYAGDTVRGLTWWFYVD